MYTAISLATTIVLAVFIFMQQARFGKLPTGERLARIKKSPNYKNGSFQNQSPTPIMSEGVSLFSLGKDFIFGKNKRLSPINEIPSVKTDLIKLEKKSDVLVWFGHSSYYIQINGKKILVDPVLSSNASPFSFSIKAFKGTDLYSTADIPEIDYLFITHDHWDHLDYETILKLKPKIKKIICGLGTGEHFERWGYDTNKIIELDWNEHVVLDSGFIANSVPARHFSGRGFRRNKTLWTSFVLQTPSMKIYMGGDGGYDDHFKEIGKEFGAFDLAILENGQHNKNWKYIHLMPDEIPKAFSDLNSRRLFTVHSSKFSLANHSWDEPLKEAKLLSIEFNIPLITPMIGEKVNLKDSNQRFSEWWEHIR
jgi:L-ascorbate metabolism protein UlaG (beta-lactamase superfamily)